MNTPKHVLLVTNSTTEEEISLIKEAVDKAKNHGLDLNLSLVHVIPNLPTCYFNIPSMVMFAERYYEEAIKSLTAIGSELGVQKRLQWLITGRTKSEVLRLAHKLDIDFVLAGGTSIQELHKPFLFVRKEQHRTPIRTIGSLMNF
jgi:nucleotide-binding universal stress UspA family protein